MGNIGKKNFINLSKRGSYTRGHCNMKFMKRAIECKILFIISDEIMTLRASNYVLLHVWSYGFCNIRLSTK